MNVKVSICRFNEYNKNRRCYPDELKNDFLNQCVGKFVSIPKDCSNIFDTSNIVGKCTNAKLADDELICDFELSDNIGIDLAQNEDIAISFSYCASFDDSGKIKPETFKFINFTVVPKYLKP